MEENSRKEDKHKKENMKKKRKDTLTDNDTILSFSSNAICLFPNRHHRFSACR